MDTGLRRDLHTQQTDVITLAPNGQFPDAYTNIGALSANGQQVLVNSLAPNFAPGLPQQWRVYVATLPP